MTEESAPSKCPVKHSGGALGNNSDMTQSHPAPSFWSQLPWAQSAAQDSSQGCKPEIPPPPAAAGIDSLEEAAKHAQTPQPDQRIRLETSRQVSGIPRGDGQETAVPHHQGEAATNKWVYPSEQQLYNAMKRKGWSNIPEESIPVVLQIHNGINERTWKQIQDWEGTEDVQLARFMGRPSDMTPKAFFMSKILRIYDAPFDRHDWYVSNKNRQGTQRYVIDYYYLSSGDPNMPPIPYVDARPAFDHPRAAWMQSRRFLQNAFPGITAYWRRFQQEK